MTRKAFTIRNAPLIADLDARVRQERARHPGRQISRESLACELLFRALRGRGRRRGTAASQ